MLQITQILGQGDSCHDDGKEAVWIKYRMTKGILRFRHAQMPDHLEQTQKPETGTT